MDSATSLVFSATENTPDTREIPLEQLAADVDIHLKVTTIVRSIDKQPQVAVAKFNSAIT